jgi:hypothetical protein
MASRLAENFEVDMSNLKELIAQVKRNTQERDQAQPCDAAKAFFGHGNVRIESTGTPDSAWMKALAVFRQRARELGMAAAIALSTLSGPAIAQEVVDAPVFAGPSGLTTAPNQERYVRVGKLPIDDLLKIRDRIGLSQSYVAAYAHPPLANEVLLSLPRYESQVIQMDLWDALDRLVRYDGDPSWEREIDRGYKSPDGLALEESVQLLEKLVTPLPAVVERPRYGQG